MEIITWNEKNATNEKGLMLRVSKKEALEIISSLATQLNSGSPNVGRAEHFTKDQTYVSISVLFEEGSSKGT